MKILIQATDLELTEPLKFYIEEKIGGLDKFLSGFDSETIQAEVEVARLTRHHRHGNVYHVDVNLSFQGVLIRAEEDNEDARAAIDAVKDKLQREIRKHKTKFEN